MAPFIRVKILKFELEKEKTTNPEYAVAINVKECVMENGK